MDSPVISSQEEGKIITRDGHVKEWNQNTYKWINNMFIEYDIKWRWIYKFFGIAYYTPDGSLYPEDWYKQTITHKDMQAYEISRNKILEKQVFQLQAQINRMNERIEGLESNMARTNSASIHNSLEDKKDIKF